MLFELLETFFQHQDHFYLYLDVASLRAVEQCQIRKNTIDCNMFRAKTAQEFEKWSM